MWKLATNKAPSTDMRGAFMQTLNKLMDTNSKLVMLEADLGGASGSGLIAKTHPHQYINAGIAEANMIGMAAGLSMQGYFPFVHSFAPFISRRAADQVYLEGAYAKNNLVIYASDPGICAAANGGTHSTYEDISYMRAIPSVQVFHPADAAQMQWLVSTLAGKDGVHYIRANRKECPDIYTADSTFEIGRGNILTKGSDVLMLAMGDLLPDALDAASTLEQKGISVQVVDMFSLKPFDKELVLDCCSGKKLVLTVENHSIYGGLGSITAEIMAESNVGVPLARIGVNDRFGEVGSVDYLKDIFQLNAKSIVNKAISILK